MIHETSDEILFGFELKNPTISNMIRWFAGTNDSSTKRLMFQVLSFFSQFLAKFFAKIVSIYLFIFFFQKFTKIRIKSFECLKSIKNYRKKMLGTSDTWSTNHLSQQTSVSYCRLSNSKLKLMIQESKSLGY